MPLDPKVRILHRVELDGVAYEIDSEDPTAPPLPLPVQRRAAEQFRDLRAISEWPSQIRGFSWEGNQAPYNIALAGFRDGTLTGGRA